MAIESNASDVQVTGGGIPLYTGIAPVSVIAVNPNLGELHSLGINLKQEPNYSGIQLGENVKNKLVFWLKNDEHNFTCRLEFFVEPTHRGESKTGKYQITNKYGQVTWAEKPDTAPDWFKREGVRRMYPGEETLISFVKAWANIPSEGECAFDTIDEIMKGNVEELKKLVTAIKDNKLRVLLGVKDEKYQNVYTRHFGRLKPANDRLFVKALNDSYGEFNAEYNDDLVLQKYSPELVKPTEESESPTPAPADGDWF